MSERDEVRARLRTRAASARATVRSIRAEGGWSAYASVYEEAAELDEAAIRLLEAPEPVRELGAIVRENRWVRLERTSPSGKVLYCCLLCGRDSQTPDKTCPAGCGGTTPCLICGEVTDRITAPVHHECLVRYLTPPAAPDGTLREALESIARNTCCEGCGEAAKVARAALGWDHV